jgi:serine/threonine-protein kinase
MTDPDRIGRYETIRLLGRGGMGTVYLARDPLIDRLLAVKMLAPGFDASARARFAREARAAGRLQHENVATIYDVGEHEEEPFIAMEYVPGDTLGALIRRPARLDLTEMLRLLEEACAGLAYAHRAGIVHLDVKPENMIRREDGRLKILDFGISKVLEGDQTHTRHLLGTLRYMSPEQLKGGPIDARSDIFAVGCVLYEAISRRPAFSGSITEIVSRIDGGDVVPLAELVPGVHPELARMTHRAMAHEAADRYGDLETLRRELSALRREVDSAADSVTIGPSTLVRPATSASRSAAPPATSPEIHVPAAPVPEPRRSHGWFRRMAVVAPVIAVGGWLMQSALDPRTGAPQGTAVPAVVESPSAAPPAGPAADDPSRAPRADAPASKAAADEAAAREALRGADRATTLKLLRDRPYLAVALIDELTAVARMTAENSQRAADAAGRRATTSPSYRSAVRELERARTLEAGGERIEALSALWQASDLFARAVAPPAAPAARVAVPSPQPIPAAPSTTDAASTTGGNRREVPPTTTQPEPARPADAGVVPAPPAPVPAPERTVEPGTETPHPKEPPPPPVENRNVAAPEAAVRAALFTYASAYQLRDIGALRRIFPGLPAAQARAQAEAFANASSYRLGIRVLDIQVSGATAVANCEVTHEFVPRVGSPSSNVQQSRFTLRQNDGAWLIERVDRAK